MVFAILCLFAIGDDPTLPPARMALTEADIFPGDRFLHSPMDAVFDGTNLWIAPGAFEIWRIDQQGNFTALGRQGQGPGEFAQEPIELALLADQIRVMERYRWQMLTFTQDGQFLNRQRFKLNNRYLAGEYLYRKLALEQVQQHKYLVMRERDGHQFMQMKQITDLQYHHAQPILAAHDQRLYMVLAQGSIVAFDHKGHALFSVELPLTDLAREAEPHPWANRMVNPNKQGKRKYYRYGVPVLAAASEAGNLWLLLSNEWQADEWARPQEVWLAQITFDSKTAQLRRHPLPFKPISIRVHNGFLTLCSKTENRISVYDTTAIANWFRTQTKVHQTIPLR